MRFSSFWHEAEGDDIAKGVFETVRTIEAEQGGANVIKAKCAQLYTNFDAVGMQLLGGMSRWQLGTTGRKLTLNVIASCIDTVAAKVAKGKPRVEFLTAGGDDDMQQRAQNMTRYIDGCFYDTQLYVAGQQAFVDACIFGTGAIKVFTRDGRVHAERVLSLDILVDSNDGLYSQPQELHQRMFIQRHVLKKVYPNLKAEIDTLQRVPGAREADDTVMVVESWRRPSTKKAGDGMHAISVEGFTLFSEKWQHDWFPFAFIRWKRPLAGFYGMSLAYELGDIQLEVNKLVQTIQLAQHLLAVPKLLVEQGSNVNLNDLNNSVAGIIKYVGTPPQVYTPAATMPAEVFNHLQWLYSKAYELSGVSQLNASSMKPAGLNSGAALRAYQDNASERFIIVGQQYSQLFVDVADIMIELSKELYSGKSKVKGLELQGTSQAFFKELHWNDVDMDRDRFFMRPYSANPLGDEPAGRLQTITELVQAGVFDRETSLALLDFPDVQAAIELETAPLQAVKAQLDRMLDSNDYEPPDEFMDLKTCIRVGQLEYNRQLAQPKPDDDKLELLRTYLREAMALAQQAQPAPAPQNDNAQMGAAANMAPAQLAG